MLKLQKLKRKLFLLSTVIICLFIGQTTFAQVVNPVKFAVVSDVHLSFKKNDDWTLYKESLVILQDIIEQINSTPDINFVVFLGDSIDNDSGDFTDLPMLLDVLDKLKSPYYMIFGDREASLAEGFSKKDFSDYFKKNGFSGENSYWQAEPVQGLSLIGLDTSIQGQFGGKIDAGQLTWLQKELCQNANKINIILMHHGALKPDDKISPYPDNAYYLDNSDEFLSLISQNPQVKMVINGHSHTKLVRKINSTIFMSNPSVVTYPNEFSLVTIYPDKISIQTKQISYKQLIKKAKKLLIDSDYAKKYDPINPKNIIKLHVGDDFSKKKTYIF